MIALDTLVGARKAGLPWRTVASTLLALEASSSLAPDGQPWIRAAAAVSGYSVNHLRRMGKALGLLQAMTALWPSHTDRLGTLSFSHAEVLGRLWETDRTQVEQLLGASAWPSYGLLLARYEQARTQRSQPKAAGKLAARHFRAEVGQWLKSYYGTDAILDPVPFHPYCKPDFLHRRDLIAFDCLLLPGKLDLDAVRRRFVAWATEASFVPAFFVVLSGYHGVDAAVRCLEELNLSNVGVLAAGRSGLQQEVSPRGVPVPDRRRGPLRWALKHEDGGASRP